MNEVYKFLKECGVFYFLTLNGDVPTGRPFGAVMESDGKLYFSTGDFKQVYRQFISHPKVQIVAKHPKSRAWIRITGTASVCKDETKRERMIAEIPGIRRKYEPVGMEHWVMIEVIPENVEWN